MLTVCSFYVDRHEDYPGAVDYIPLLKALDRSCKRLGFAHVVLTDLDTAPFCHREQLLTYEHALPRNLTKALTESQARWLESRHLSSSATLFVGADCLMRNDLRGQFPEGDLAIAFRPENKRHRLQNGFMFVPVVSRAKVAPLFRRIADSCGDKMCDDLLAVEQALSPMPETYGLHERSGLVVNFVPMMPWQGLPSSVDDPIEGAFVLHFRSQRRKKLMLDWAARWLA